MKVSKRALSIPPSETIAVTTRAKQLKAQGIDVVSFGAGEPDFDTPQFIKHAAIDALQKGQTKYTPTPGIPELRKAIANKLRTENNLNYTPEQIIVNIGAKHSIYESMQAVLDPGDEVLMPAPYWVTYPEAVKLAGAIAKVLKTDASTSYKITAKQLKAAIGKKTALLILNSPNNPGGFTYSPDELSALADVLKGTDVMVISDEIYEKLVYNGTKFVSFASLNEDAYNRTLTVNGFSKAYSMTGWRLGYTAGPLNAIKAMDSLQSHMTQNSVAFAQYAAIAALEKGDNDIEKMRLQFEKRGHHMAERLNAIDGVKCLKPTGAFYCFPDVSAHYNRTIDGVKINSSGDMAQALIEKANVAIVPGAAFGCPGNIRLSFACSMEQIDKGIDRLEKWLKK